MHSTFDDPVSLSLFLPLSLPALTELIRDSRTCIKIRLRLRVQILIPILRAGLVVIQTSPDCDQYSGLGFALDFFVLLSRFSCIDCLKINNIYATKVCSNVTFSLELYMPFEGDSNNSLSYNIKNNSNWIPYLLILKRQFTMIFPNTQLSHWDLDIMIFYDIIEIMHTEDEANIITTLALKWHCRLQIV